MAKDYYDTLGVSRTASPEEIKKAFRRLAHQHHPDKGGGDDAKFKEINEAYQVLSNPEKRKQYDQFGQTFDQARAGGGFGGFGGFEEAFRQGGFRTEDVGFDFGNLGDIFGDFFGAGRRPGRTKSRAGSDIEAELPLTFEQAAFGADKPIRLQKAVRCETCGGNGAAPDAKVVTCSTCGGSGQVTTVQRTILGSFQSVSTCPECEGQGRRPERKCPTCRGEGRVRDQVTLNVRVPAGIDEGEKIRIEGQGEAGGRGAAAGDLYLTVHIEPHPSLTRKGADVYSEADMSFPLLTLGGKVTVDTVDGPVVMKVPAGTQSGSQIRLKGKGIPHLKGRGRGDHFVKVNAVTPEHLSRRERELLEELQKLQP